MALSDLKPAHQNAVRQAINYFRDAVDDFQAGELENFYTKLALGARNIDNVLAVIEDPKDKPRNEPSNGHSHASEKR